MSNVYTLSVSNQSVCAACIDPTGEHLYHLSHDRHSYFLRGHNVGNHQYYSVLPEDEERVEKERVRSLLDYWRTMELRDMDTKIARLNCLRGVNNGDLYTMR